MFLYLFILYILIFVRITKEVYIFYFKVVETDAETARRKAVIDAERDAQVAKIQIQQKLLEKELLQKIELIDNSIHKAKQQVKTEAEFYNHMKQAEANKLLLTKEYLELKKYETLSASNREHFKNEPPNNSDIFFDTLENTDSKVPENTQVVDISV